MMQKASAVKLASMAAISAAGLAMTSSASAELQFRERIENDMSICDGTQPAILVNISEIKNSNGQVRVQLYPGTKEDWLERGRWIHRIEVPAQEGNMSFCFPVPEVGTYAIAARHDSNDNGSTDIFSDGGAMSRNPSINIFNLGKPSYRRTRFDAGEGLVTMDIRMRYM